MVNGSILAAICVELGLHEFIMIRKGSDMIPDYISQLASKRTLAHYWTEVEPPKVCLVVSSRSIAQLSQVLSDVLEAVIGAVYVASGFQSSQIIFDNVLQPFYEQHLMPPDKHISLSNIPVHPTKILLELIQQHGCTNFKIDTEKPDDGKGMICSGMPSQLSICRHLELNTFSACT